MDFINGTYGQALSHVLRVLKQDIYKMDSLLTGACARNGLGRRRTRLAKFICAALIATIFIAVGVFLGWSFLLIQWLGLAGMILILKGLTFQDNRHKRALVSVGGLLTTTQMGLLHAWGGLLQSGIATSRAFAMAAIPDEKRRIRLAATLAFYAAALVIYKYILPESPYNILPLATMSFGTLADFFPSRMSRHTNVAYMLGTAAIIPYHIFVSHSWGALGVTIGTIAVLYRTARQYDMPVRAFDGAPISAFKSHCLWIKSLLNADPIAGLSAKQWAEETTGESFLPLPFSF